MKIIEEDGAGIGGVSSAGAMGGGSVAIPGYGNGQLSIPKQKKFKHHHHKLKSPSTLIKMDKQQILSLTDKYK